MTSSLLIPSCLNAIECNVLKYGNLSSSRLNFAMALSIASFAALRVNARYAILSGLTPRAKAVSTIFKSAVVFPVPGGPYNNTPAGGVIPILTNASGSTDAAFNVIIPPQDGHGADIYKELGASRVLIYSRLENDVTNPDFITGNQFARLGLVRDPYSFGSTNKLTVSKASAVYALKLTGAGSTTATFTADSEITQQVGVGSTAVGRVVNYDPVTGVLKYWQDRRLAGFNTDGTLNANPEYGFSLFRFTAESATGSGTTIFGGSTTLNIDTNFGTSAVPGISTSINNRTYSLGMSFVEGLANPEVEKYSGDIIYVDNRAPVTRSSQQKEDIKIVLEF